MSRSEKYKIVLFNDSLVGGAGKFILALSYVLIKNMIKNKNDS
jgi:hypothetical protein